MRRGRLLVFLFLIGLDRRIGQPVGTDRNDGTDRICRIIDRSDGRRITVDVLALGGQ
jgi:hypothetical protein